MPSFAVNQARLWQSLMDMAKIGALPGGGCCRLALTAEDGRGRDLFVSWCRDAGCDVQVDQVGNIFARRPGQSGGLPSIATGSHLDTQPHGGKFDGIYGVMAGLEAIRTLNDYQIKTQHPIDVIVWTNEEASRFPPPLMGSSVFAGAVGVKDVHSTPTTGGGTVAGDLEKIGYLGPEIPGTRQFAAFIETHIEQGPILEAAQKTIGLVTGVQGLRFLSVTVEGEDAHAGTTPMSQRKDALSGAAQMLMGLQAIVAQSDDKIRLTVGQFNVSPNSGSTIPGKVQFTIDLRHPDGVLLQGTQDHIGQMINAMAAKAGLTVQIAEKMTKPPTPFDPQLIELIEKAAQSLKLPHMRMISGAGHDAVNIARLAPTAMIFVPCRNGISHNEREYATPEHLAAGANVLLHTLLHKSKIV